MIVSNTELISEIYRSLDMAPMSKMESLLVAPTCAFCSYVSLSVCLSVSLSVGHSLGRSVGPYLVLLTLGEDYRFANRHGIIAVTGRAYCQLAYLHFSYSCYLV